MQRFVNNWSATLQAPLLAADGEMAVEPSKGALLSIPAGDFMDLTLEPQGSAPEVVRVVARSGGVLTISARGLESSNTPSSWPAGTVVRCCATAGYLESLQQQASGGARGYVRGSGSGTIVVPADTALIHVPFGTGDLEFALPTPELGEVLAIDVLLENMDDTSTFTFSLPGATQGETNGFERVQAEMVAFADGYFVVERLRNTCMLRFYLMGNATPEFAILDLYHRPALPT